MVRAIMFLFLWLLLLTGAGAKAAAAQPPDSLDRDEAAPPSNHWVVLPILYSSPETGFGFGGVASHTFRWRGANAESPPSQITLGVSYTTENQLLSYLPFNLYSRGERYHFLGELGYYIYVYKFFGIGNETPSEEEYYDADFPRLRLYASRRLRPHLYGGLYLHFDHFDVHDLEPGGRLEEQQPSGLEGGSSVLTGVQASWDSRDHVLYPTRGIYSRLLIADADAVIGSDYEYRLFRLDSRHFIPLGGNWVLGSQIILETTPGQPPFYDLTTLGGSTRMRGAEENRWLGRTTTFAQVEARLLFLKRFGAVAFASAGGVDTDSFTFLPDGWHWGAGLGLRYSFDPANRFYVRMDYGISEDMSGFYISGGQAF